MNAYEIFLSPDRAINLDAGKVEEDKKAVTFYRDGNVVAKFFLGGEKQILGYQRIEPPGVDE